MTKVNQYRVIVWLLLLYSIAGNSFAQPCNLIVYDTGSGANTSGLSLTGTFTDKNSCIEYVNRLPGLLISKGYIAASVDSVWEDSSIVYIKLFAGEKYEWNSITLDDKAWSILSTAGYTKNIFRQVAFNPGTITTLYKNVLDYCSNNGHPFAKIFFDSLRLDNNKNLYGSLHIEEGPLYHIDSVIMEDDAIISKKFIEKYIGIQEGDMYRQNFFNDINNRMQQLPYLQQHQPWQAEMLNTGAILHLYPEPLRSNDINILIGLLPANEQTGGKILFTGDAKIDLRNSFKTGETISLNWQQLQPRSPHLNLSFTRPYIFSSGVGLNFSFDLYKKDSDFLNIQSQTALEYTFSKYQTGAVLFQTLRSNILSVDTLLVRATKTLPPNIDMGTVSLGFQYNFTNTNYRFNPRSGNDLRFTGSFGNKKIRKNASITQIKDPLFNYNSLYDTVQLNSYQFRIQATATHYFPVGKQATVKLALNSGWYQSPDYFQNELFRIGGFRLLRGFDEESIFTNLYSIATAEYRYLLAKNSYLFSFTDAGKVRFVNTSNSYITTYIGLGAGLVFETPSGIFNISYAVGKHGYNAIDLRQSKIHLGFVSLF